MITLPSDEIMREMTKLAVEVATEMFAVQALDFAQEFKSGRLPTTDAVTALEAFAAAIRSTNKRRYDSSEKPS